MKSFYLFLLFSAAVGAQPSVKGTLISESAAHSRDYIVRNTKIVLQSGLSVDTVHLDENLEFEFQRATKGPASLYLISPVLPERTRYQFRIHKSRQTHVSIRYDRFQTQPARRFKSPDEREEDFQKGLFFVRLAADIAILIHAISR